MLYVQAARRSSSCAKTTTAQQLNSSTAQQRIAKFLAVLITTGFAGCVDALPTGIAGQAAAKPAPTEIDAGIVFADRESYLCVSFQQLGLSNVPGVSSITSSCDCIEPSVVSYRSSPGQSAQAVLLRFVREHEDSTARVSSERASDSVRVNLGVLIDLKFADGSFRQIRVSLQCVSSALEVLP